MSLMRRASGGVPEFFRVESMRVITDELPDGEFNTEATVKVWVGSGDEAERHVWVAEGNGPVNALDAGLRKALLGVYPCLDEMRLLDYKVRVVDSGAGTAASIRVNIESGDEHESWGTIGVSENIIEASWQALADGICYHLMQAGVTPILAEYPK